VTSDDGVGCEGDSGTLTPLHVAATHGLMSFAQRLSAIPDAFIAASLVDFDGQLPGDVARCHGNTVTADVIDRLTNQRTTSGSTGKCNTLQPCFSLQNIFV